MVYKITKKQNDCDWCFVCGKLNDYGLHSAFYETECGSVIAIFKPDNKHHGYPNVLHGGITSRKLMSTINSVNNKIFCFTKGAFDVLLKEY